MRSLLRKVIKWAITGERSSPIREDCVAPSLSGPHNTGLVSDGKIRLAIHAANNGRILEVMTHSPNPHGPDWTSEYYIVAEGEALSDTVTMVLIAKNVN